MRSLSLASASNFIGSLSSSKEAAFFTINRNVQTYESEIQIKNKKLIYKQQYNQTLLSFGFPPVIHFYCTKLLYGQGNR